MCIYIYVYTYNHVYIYYIMYIYIYNYSFSYIYMIVYNIYINQQIGYGCFRKPSGGAPGRPSCFISGGLPLGYSCETSPL